MAEQKNDLKKRILEEMTVDYSSALEKNFDLAKQFIRITKDGEIDILPKNMLTSKEQILLYLIGKLYAKEAGYIDTVETVNEELLSALGMPRGTLDWSLKELHDGKKIKTAKKRGSAYHSILVNLVEKTLESVARKLKKSVWGG